MPVIAVEGIPGTLEAKFAKKLAANDKKTRDRMFNKLRQFLLAKSIKPGGGFDRVELIRIWKGLFYCMWMSDKPLVQEQLAKNMAEILPQFNNIKASMLYFETFLTTIHREWRGIDRLRMDKFYLLARFMLQQAFVCLKNNNWDDGIVDWFISVLRSGPICPTAPTANISTGPPLGIRLHFADIYLEELTACAYGNISSEKVTKFIMPYCLMMCNTPVKMLRDRAIDKIFNEIIDQSDPAIKVITEETGEDYLSLPDERLKYDYTAIADALFELANQENAMARNRQQVYKLVQKFREVSQGRLPLDDYPDLLPVDEKSILSETERLTKKLMEEMDTEFKENMKEKEERRKEMIEKKKLESANDDNLFLVDGSNYDLEINSMDFHADEADDNENMSVTKRKIKSKTKKGKKAAEIHESASRASKKVVPEDADEFPSDSAVVMGSAFTSEDASVENEEDEPENDEDADTTMLELLENAPMDDKEEVKHEASKRDVKEMMMDLVDEPNAVVDEAPTKKNKQTEKGDQPKVNGSEIPKPKSQPKKKKVRVRGKVVKQNKRNAELKEMLKAKLNANSNCNKTKQNLSDQTNSDVAMLDTNLTNTEVFAKFTKPVSNAAFLRVAISKVNQKLNNKSQKNQRKSEVVESSSPKRVSFEMSKIQVQPFKKNDRSSVLSPSPLTIPFDPKKTPDFGLLKKKKATKPHSEPKRKRPKASDFFQ